MRVGAAGRRCRPMPRTFIDFRRGHSKWICIAMSHVQPMPLSQEANKASGICSVCRATRQLHLKYGTVHWHGPRNNPCPGSHILPISSVIRSNNTDLYNAPVMTSSDTHPSSSAASDIPQKDISSSWSSITHQLIKHIPKSARSACSSHLAKLLRSVVAHPEIIDNWYSLFNWSGSVLLPPKRGGKRHNHTATIKKRIEEFSNDTIESKREPFHTKNLEVNQFLLLSSSPMLLLPS